MCCMNNMWEFLLFDLTLHSWPTTAKSWTYSVKRLKQLLQEWDSYKCACTNMVQWLGLLQTRSTTDWTDKLSYLKTKVQTFLIKLVFVKHKVCLSAQLTGNALFLVKVTICQQGALQSKKAVVQWKYSKNSSFEICLWQRCDRNI